jgi:hypothetical protein
MTTRLELDNLNATIRSDAKLIATTCEKRAFAATRTADWVSERR